MAVPPPNFPRICASEPARRLSLSLQFDFHISFFVVFCFTFLLLDAVLGDETPFVVTPCTKVKVALQNLVFLSFLSSRCMHYL